MLDVAGDGKEMVGRLELRSARVDDDWPTQEYRRRDKAKARRVESATQPLYRNRGRIEENWARGRIRIWPAGGRFGDSQ